MPTLFDPIRLGDIACSNRIFMSPLTRARATVEGVPTPVMAEYYAQRASAGLIISEAIAVSAQGRGWLNTPGIYTEEQIEAWKPVTKAVHEKGGKIVAQIWHMGRMAHSANTGEEIVAPSAIAAPGYAHTLEGKTPYETPRALTVEEIKLIVLSFAEAAANAIRAGFDGVQIHAANGYIIDEFLRDSANKRTDEYGGTPENRMRFLRGIVQATAQAVGIEKVGVRLSPNGSIQGTVDSDPQSLFVPVAEMLNELNVPWLELRESGDRDDWIFEGTDQKPLSPILRKIFKNILVLNQDYDFAQAEKAVQTGAADAIAFGRLFISNPDLPERFRKNLPLAQGDMATWYSPTGAKGYTDYPTAE